MKANFSPLARDGRARFGMVTTARGSFTTPCFMPVGTRGAVPHLSSADLESLGVEVMLANTYHLMLRPGADTVAMLGGLHGFMGWSGQVLTDSGGYQIFSLDPEVDDQGAGFKSIYDGSSHLLTPERAARLQARLGADIQMVLDVCAPARASLDVWRAALERTALWAQRGRRAFLDHYQDHRQDHRQDHCLEHRQEHREDQHQEHRRVHSQAVAEQCQFGIVQGGLDESLRLESAQRTVGVGFDGYAIGGLSVGEDRDEMLPALDAAIGPLPDDQPRYMMGLGDPLGIVESVARGVDMFDCVLPARLGRHGTVLSDAGRFNLARSEYAGSNEPLDESFPESPAGNWSRGYLRHLLVSSEPTAARLLTLHNLAWLLRFMDRLRSAIREQRFETERGAVRRVWAR